MQARALMRIMHWHHAAAAAAVLPIGDAPGSRSPARMNDSRTSATVARVRNVPSNLPVPVVVAGLNVEGGRSRATFTSSAEGSTPPAAGPGPGPAGVGGRVGGCVGGCGRQAASGWAAAHRRPAGRSANGNDDGGEINAPVRVASSSTALFNTDENWKGVPRSTAVRPDISTYFDDCTGTGSGTDERAPWGRGPTGERRTPHNAAGGARNRALYRRQPTHVQAVLLAVRLQGRQLQRKMTAAATNSHGASRRRPHPSAASSEAASGAPHQRVRLVERDLLAQAMVQDGHRRGAGRHGAVSPRVPTRQDGRAR